jgi:hypothetical protein
MTGDDARKHLPARCTNGVRDDETHTSVELVLSFPPSPHSKSKQAPLQKEAQSYVLTV